MSMTEIQANAEAREILRDVEESNGMRGSLDSSPLSCSASITVRRGFEGWGVQFHYGVQHFDVGPQNFGMEREAEWMASMFSNALANMHAGNEPS